MVDTVLARQRGATETIYVRVGEGELTHIAPSSAGGIWPETFCGKVPSHGLPRKDGDLCGTCEKRAAAFLSDADAEPVPATSEPAPSGAKLARAQRAEAEAARRPTVVSGGAGDSGASEITSGQSGTTAPAGTGTTIPGTGSTIGTGGGRTG